MAEIDTDLFNLPNELIPVFLSLIVAGKCDTHRAFYKNHTTLNNTTHCVMEVNLPLDRSTKGGIILVPMEEISYDEPRLTAEMRHYPKRTYMGHNIYLHPEHDDMSKRIKAGQDSDVKERVGLVIIAGRGCFTFKL
jgi:hypothetical protein